MHVLTVCSFKLLNNSWPLEPMAECEHSLTRNTQYLVTVGNEHDNCKLVFNIEFVDRSALNMCQIKPICYTILCKVILVQSLYFTVHSLFTVVVERLERSLCLPMTGNCILKQKFYYITEYIL